MKKTISLFLSLILIMGVFFSVPVTVNAASVDDLTFELNEDGVSYSVTDCDEEATGEIVIPETYNGLPVTRINNSSFDYCENITSIIIPNSVIEIDVYAFYGCSSLSLIVIPDGVLIIGRSAFNGCDSLITVTIPKSVANIEEDAFSFCDNLSSINVTADNPVFSSVDGVLFNAEKTKLIRFPEGKMDTSYTVPDTVTSVDDGAFAYCEKLETIILPDSVGSLGEGAFLCCTSLTSINIPDKITVLSDSLFARCESLTSVDISANVNMIYIATFSSCSSLTDINVSPENLNYTSVNGVLFNKNKTSIIKYPEGKKATTYSIPETVKIIDNCAFDECENLTSVIIPESVTEINPGAFELCTGLKSMVIPNSVKYIDFHAFGLCSNLESIVLPNSIPRISYGTFWGCKKLKTIEIPETVTEIGDNAFYGCSSLSSIDILGEVSHIGDYTFAGCNTLKSLEIPESVKSIGYASVGYSDADAFGLYKTPDFIVYGVKDSYAETYANENGFEFLETCFHESTKWITDEKATVNAAGSKHKECTECGEVLETAVIPQLKPATPKLTKVTNTASGVKFTWSEVEGADSYIVYRRAYDAKTKKWSSWKNIASGVTTTSYVDKTAKSGTYYIYTVKANNEAGYGGHTSGLKIYFLSTPKVTTANANAGVTVKWTKSAGATGYIVYRKSGNGKWQNLGKTTGTSFTDKKATAGVTYKYTVKAYYGSYVSAYNTSGVAVRRLTTPNLVKVVSSKSGVTFNWGKVTGTTGYIVYRKTGNGGWVKLATVKGNSKVSYLDKTAKKGVTYKYTVRAYYGTSTSYYNTKGLTIKDKY